VGLNGKKGSADIPTRLRRLLKPLEDLPLAEPVRQVLIKALEGKARADVEDVDKAVRWLTAAYDKPKDAKEELGVHAILGDDDLFDYLALLARLLVICGWRGLLVILDEASNIAIYNDKSAREVNWAGLHNAVNSIHRGDAPNFGLMLIGTEDLIDMERGLLSNSSLESRLAPVASGDGAAALGPIIRLRRFSREEYYVLLQGFRDLVFPAEERTLFPDEDIEALLNEKFFGLGADQSLTTRDILKEFAAAAMRRLATPELEGSTLLSRDTTEAETK
jgi:hypothetical protein